MQQHNANLGEKFYIAITVTIWVAGLLIAGSENDFMPWINGAGLVLFLISSVLLGKFLRQLEPDVNMVMFPGFFKETDFQSRTIIRKNCRVGCRYAMHIR